MTTAQAGIPTTPTTEELVDRARAALQRCGVDPHTLTADAESITASSPLTGEALFDVPASTARRRGGRDPGRAHGLPDLAQRTGTRAGRVDQAPR